MTNWRTLVLLVWTIIESFDKLKRLHDFMEPFQLIKEGLAEFRPQGRNKIQSIFCRDMRVAKNTSQPANVQIVFHRKTMRALQQAASPSC